MRNVQMKKQIRALILALLFAITLLPAAVFAAENVATIGETGYATLAEAAAAARSGDTIKLLGDVSESVEIPDGVTFNGNGKTVTGTISAAGNLTFDGVNKVTAFNAGFYNHVITIGEGASLEITGTSRMTIGWGNVFNITGGIENAKTADKSAITPSLKVHAGVSITGSGATLNVADAYVVLGQDKTNTSKPGDANGVFTINFDNSIADFSKNFCLYASTGTAAPTFTTSLKDSVVNVETNLVFSNKGCTTVIDNTNVTVGSSMRNSGTMTIQNGSDVYVASMIQFGENAGNDGAIIVDNAKLKIDCSTSGHAMDGNGTGSLLLRNNAVADIDYVTETGIATDSSSTMTNADGGLIGGTTVVENPVAKVDGTFYTDFTTALKAITGGATFELLQDVTVSDKWDCRNTGGKITVPVTINGNGHTIKVTGEINDGGNHFAVFRLEGAAEVKNLTIDVSEAAGVSNRIRAISAKGDLTVENCKFIGSTAYTNTRAIIFGEGSGTAIGELDVSITGCEFTNWRYGVTDNENGQDAKSVTLTDSKFDNADVQLSAQDSATFTGNEMTDSWVSITSYSAEGGLDVTANGNTLAANGDSAATTNRIVFKKNPIEIVAADPGFVSIGVAKVGEQVFGTLQAAVDACTNGTVTLLENISLDARVNIAANQTITLDLNGKIIDGTEKTNIALMSYGNLTLKDSSEAQTGAIKAGIGTAGNAVNICGGTFTMESGSIYSKNNAILIDEQAAQVTIQGGTITADPATWNSAVMYISSTSDTTVTITGGEMVGYNGILLWNNTTIEMTGGSIDARGSLGIQGNGSKDNTEISISGDAEITGYYAAIYHPQGGKLTIADNAKLSGWTGVVHKGGELVISGGTIAGTGAADDYAPVSSGFLDTGDGLYTEQYDNSTSSDHYGPTKVTITGGTFTSVNGYAVASYANPNNDVTRSEGFISAGTFIGAKPMDEALLVDGVVLNQDGTVKTPAYAGPAMNTVKVNPCTNGTVKAGPISASAGSTVTLYTKADAGDKLAGIPVLDRRGALVSVTDGKFVMPEGGVTVTATFAAEDQAAHPFTDLAGYEYFEPAITYCYQNGLMIGTSAATFGPAETLSRAQVVTVLHRLAGTPAAPAHAFSDVPAGEYYTAAVSWAAEAGITIGYGDGKFGPEDSITVEQLVAFLHRWEQLKNGGITETSLEAAMTWAAAEGLFGDMTVTGSADAARCQTALVLMNYLK